MILLSRLSRNITLTIHNQYFTTYQANQYIVLNYYSNDFFKYGILESPLLESSALQNLYLEQTTTSIHQNANLAFKALLYHIKELEQLSTRLVVDLKREQRDYMSLQLYERTLIEVDELMNQISRQSPTFCEDVTELAKTMQRLNILNPSVWRKLNNLVCDNIDRFTSAMMLDNDPSLLRILKCYTMYLKSFVREDIEVSSKQLVISEKEISSFLRKEHVLMICRSLSQSFKNESKKIYPCILIECDYQILFKTIVLIDKLCQIIKRVSYISNQEFKLYLNEPVAYVFAHAEQMDHNELLNIYQVLVEFSMATPQSLIRINALLSTAIQSHIRFNPQISDIINKILICWKKHGSYDHLLYKKLQPHFQAHVSSLIKPQQVVTCAYLVTTAQIDDLELIQMLVFKFSQFSYEELSIMQRKLAHLFFRVVQICYDINLQACQLLIQKLNGFCLAKQEDLMSRYNNQVQLHTCKRPHMHKHNLLQYQNTHKQYYGKAHPEMVLLKAFIRYLNENISQNESINYIIDFKHCMFMIDFAIIVDEKYHIAVEVCGDFYGLDTGLVIGKKRTKFRILENDGWELVIIKTNQLQTNLGFERGEQIQQEIERIIEVIEKRIGRKLGRKAIQKKSVFLQRNTVANNN